MGTPVEGLARLHPAVETGDLDALCRRHRIRVLTVFGSAARGEPDARDLDIVSCSSRTPRSTCSP